MNSRQKQAYLDALKREKAVLEQLEKEYRAASKECSDKIAALNARTDLQNLQSIIYQKKYQEMLKGQIDAALKDLHDNSYREICDFLENQYSTGFTGALYDMQGQGVPLTIPFNHDAVIKAIENDSKLSKPMYDALGENITTLKSAVRSEVSRGIALGKSWVDVAQGISKSMVSSPFNTAANNSMRIARTEGQRVLNQARFDSQLQAKAMGADVVKQWDSTLDGRTRPWHRECDGQIREMNEDFDVGGERMKAPCIGGSAKNVINCRCALLQRARWALDEPFTKADSFSGEIREFKSPADYATFKQNYWSSGNVKYMKYVQDLQVCYGTKNMQTLLDAMTDREYKHYHELLDANPFYKKKKVTWRQMRTDMQSIDGEISQKQQEIKNAEITIRQKETWESMYGDEYSKLDGVTRDDLIKQRDELQAKVDKALDDYSNFKVPEYPEQIRRRDFTRHLDFEDPRYDELYDEAIERFNAAKAEWQKGVDAFNEALAKQDELRAKYFELDRELSKVKVNIRNWNRVEQYRKYMTEGEAAERTISRLQQDVSLLKNKQLDMKRNITDLIRQQGAVVEHEDVDKLISMLPKDNQREFLKLLNDCPNADTRTAFIRYMDELKGVTYGKDLGVYRPSLKQVEYGLCSDTNVKNGMGRFRTLNHETHHYIDDVGTFEGATFKEVDAINASQKGAFVWELDHVASSSDEFLEAMRKDKAALEKLNIFADTEEAYDLRMKFMLNDGTCVVQDALDGMFVGSKNRIAWGHGEKYYNDRYNNIKNYGDTNALRSAFGSVGIEATSETKVKELMRSYRTTSEMWANIGAAEIDGGKELEAVRKYLPNSYQAYKNLMKRMV